MKHLIIVVVLLASVACGSTPVAPTPIAPVVPSCQANNTASVSFGNRSTATTQDVFWDGLKIATLTPGATTGGSTVAAGVSHTLAFRVTNTTLTACTTSTPIPAQCALPVYTCSFP